MSKPCLLHPEKGDTNSRDGICCICKVFEKEKVAEYLKTHEIPLGARPKSTCNHAPYGYASRQECIKNGTLKLREKKTIHRLNRGITDRKLSKAEESIFNMLSTIGEDVEIIKKLEESIQ